MSVFYQTEFVKVKQAGRGVQSLVITGAYVSVISGNLLDGLESRSGLARTVDESLLEFEGTVVKWTNAGNVDTTVN